MKDLQVTLYDVFGYLLPGAVLLAAIGTFYWALFFPMSPLWLVDFSPATWIIIGLGSYVLGHFAQALANMLPWLFPRREVIANSPESRNKLLAPTLVAATKAKLCQAASVSPDGLDDAEVLATCARLAKLCDGAGTDSLYGYREGFYRGLSVAAAIFAVGLITRAIRGSTTILHDGITQPVTRAQMLFLAILLVGFSFLARRRYERFALYRAQHALISVLFGFPAKEKSSKVKAEP